MTDKNSPDDYILEKPHGLLFKDVYVDGAKSMSLPVPSTPILKFPFFNKLTGGLRPREFSILCGATGIGKTTLMANISHSLIEQDVPHYVYSVETGYLDFVRRVISVAVNEDWNTGEAVPIEKIKKFTEENKEKIKNSSLYLSLWENRFTVEKLMSEIAYDVKHRGCKIAIVDNLNFFLQVTKSADQLLEMDRVIHELVIFCKRIDVHVIMIMHPKKTESMRVENEGDIRGSALAVQEASNIFLFNRASEELIEQGLAKLGDRELKIQKMRRIGKAVGGRIILTTKNGVRYEERSYVSSY